MTGSIDTNRSLAYGLVLSLAFHAAAVVGLVNQGVFSAGRSAETVLVIPPEDEARQEPPKPEPQPPEATPLQLGIEESTANTKTWIGFQTPTEHSGLKSDTEQAQVAENPGGTPPAPTAEETQVQSPPAENPQPQDQPPEPTPTEPTPSEPQPEPAPPVPVSPPEDHSPQPVPAEKEPPASAPLPQPVEQPENAPEATPGEEKLPEADSPEALPEEQKPENRPETPIVQPPEPDSTPAPVQPPPPAPPAPKEAAREATAATPPKPAKEYKSRADFMGIADDRVAVATALKEALQVIPGRPVAAKGMRIRTVPPKPSVTTQITAAPRNSVMWVIFGPDGKVKDTDFFAGQSTGSEGWDGALRSAVFAWRASGEEIEKLPKNDPRAGISVMFKISMR